MAKAVLKSDKSSSNVNKGCLVFLLAPWVGALPTATLLTFNIAPLDVSFAIGLIITFGIILYFMVDLKKKTKELD